MSGFRREGQNAECLRKFTEMSHKEVQTSARRAGRDGCTMGRMTLPRSQLIDRENGGWHHVVSRCVRRAWLLGEDSRSGLDFSHRRGWIEERMLALSEVFTVRVYGYAMMSNHFHVALEYRPRDALALTEEEVARRWLRVFPPGSAEHLEAAVEALTGDPERLAVLRARLADLSWFMRCLNEQIARRANREDGCTGRLWEGRFHSSKPLKSLRAVHACMAYVDLNPLRAGATSGVAEAGERTSVRRRVEESGRDGGKLEEALAPMRLDGEVSRVYTAPPTSLEVRLSTYLEHLEWTARIDLERRAGRGAEALGAPAGMDDPEGFLGLVRRYHRRWGRREGRGDVPPAGNEGRPPGAAGAGAGR